MPSSRMIIAPESSRIVDFMVHVSAVSGDGILAIDAFYKEQHNIHLRLQNIVHQYDHQPISILSTTLHIN